MDKEQEKIIHDCLTENGGKHHLEVIYRIGNDLSEEVIRWCPKCGAIVVDVDYDNRTKPGAFMKMRYPEIFYTL